jgi:hypothetical protein
MGFWATRHGEKGQQAQVERGPVARGSGSFLCPLRGLDSALRARCCALRSAAVPWWHQEAYKIYEYSYYSLDFFFDQTETR